MPTRKQRRPAQLECYACGYEFVASVPQIAQEPAWVGEDDSLHLVGQSLEPLVLLRRRTAEAFTRRRPVVVLRVARAS
jgi:hypothetical protein